MNLNIAFPHSIRNTANVHNTKLAPRIKAACRGVNSPIFSIISIKKFIMALVVSGKEQRK